MMTPAPGDPSAAVSVNGSSSASAGSSAIQTTTYIGDTTVPVSMISVSGEYAYSCQRGLFTEYGRSSVQVSISASLHVVAFAQFIMLVAALRSRRLPSPSVRVPLGAPSMNDDCNAPDRMRFQSGTVSKSCI